MSIAMRFSIAVLALFANGCFEVSKFTYDGQTQLLATYAVPACAACMRQKCASELEACAGNLACVELMDCLSEHPYPTAAMDCSMGQYVAPGGEEAGALNSCQESCAESCDLGNEWGCVGNYGPQITRDSVVLSQRLFDPQTSKPWPGVEVRLCADLTEAFRYSGTVTRDAGSDSTPCEDGRPELTDHDGYYRVELPIQRPRPGYVGWRGARLVTSPEGSDERVLTQILVRNVPIWTHMNEQTGLLSERTATSYMNDELLGLLGQAPDVGMAAVQVFDCRGYPAVGAKVRARGETDVWTIYPERSDSSVDFFVSLEPTRLTAGLSVVGGMESGKEYVFEAYVGERVVAQSDPISVPPVAPNVAVRDQGMLVLTLYPDYDPTAN